MHNLKRTCFVKKNETSASLMKLIGKTSHATNSVDSEMPIALGCVECLLQTLKLLEQDIDNVVTDLSYGALDTCMRLDSAAAEAVNLLPKPDHPSQFGSLYGILNRCRTKLGSRLLDRYAVFVVLLSLEFEDTEARQIFESIVICTVFSRHFSKVLIV